MPHLAVPYLSWGVLARLLSAAVGPEISFLGNDSTTTTSYLVHRTTSYIKVVDREAKCDNSPPAMPDCRVSPDRLVLTRCWPHSTTNFGIAQMTKHARLFAVACLDWPALHARGVHPLPNSAISDSNRILPARPWKKPVPVFRDEPVQTVGILCQLAYSWMT